MYEESDAHKKEEKDAHTWFDTLAVLPFLGLSLSLRYSILEVSCSTFYVKDKLFDISHYVLDWEMQLTCWTEISLR